MTENKSINRILICPIIGMYALWGCLHLYNSLDTTTCIVSDESAELLISQSDNTVESSEFAISQGDITKYEDYRAHYTGTVFVPAHASQIPGTRMSETAEVEMTETTESLTPEVTESSETPESPTLVMSATTESPVITEPEITESPVITEPEITESPVVVAEIAPATKSWAKV